MNIFIDDIDSIRIQKATKASISSSKSLKKSKMGLKNDKRAIMQQKVRLLILKHIKLEDIDLWFRTFISHFLICFQCILFIYMLEI